MNMRRPDVLVAVLAVVLLVLSLAGCSTEYKTFSGYGFSFDYPDGFALREFGVQDDQANDVSGAVQVTSESGGTRGFQVSWMDTMIYSLESTLQGALAGMEKPEEIASVDGGETVEGEKAGHRMLYQYYTMTTTQGDEAHGIAATFFCNESHRLFVLVTTNGTVSANDDVLEDFNTYLDSFACH